MIRRIKTMDILPDYELLVAFDDNRVVLYDVKEDMRTMPGYDALLSNELFQEVKLDESRTCVFWTPEIDLPSDVIYDYGIPVPDTDGEERIDERLKFLLPEMDTEEHEG